MFAFFSPKRGIWDEKKGNPPSQAGHPFRLLPLVAATFPKGTAFSVAVSFLFALDTLSTKGNGVRPLSHLR